MAATKAAPSTSGASRRAPAKTPAGGSGAGTHRGKQAVEGKAAKAAAAEAAGGGPEDPLADVAAAGALLGGRKKKSGSGSGSGPGAKAQNLAKKSPLLLAEFIICFVILGLGTLASPKGSANAGIPRLMLKSSALAGVFLALSLTSAVGGKAAKTAGALGGLVTVTYLVASPDAIAVFKWSTSYFGGAKAATAAAGSTAEAAAAAGAQASEQAQPPSFGASQ